MGRRKFLRNMPSALPTMSEEAACEALSEWILREKSVGVILTKGDMSYYSWPQTFGSTSGPFGGIGGCAMTDFQMEAWAYSGFAVIFCCGKILDTIDSFDGTSYRYERKR